MRKLIVVLLLLFTATALPAQKKEIAIAKANIKKMQNLEQAESSMRTLLKDSANLANEKIWLTLFDAVRKQYEQLNEKLYLKQQSDTAKFFRHTLHMFQVLESLDSIDARQVKQTGDTPRFRKSHSAYLNQYRDNLYAGGAYFVGKQQYTEAYTYFDAYMDCVFQPLFSGYKYATKDKNMIPAAYWAVLCAYKSGDADKAMKYYNVASQDLEHRPYLLQCLAEIKQMQGADEEYVAALEEGFNDYPENSFFFPHLAYVYGSTGRYTDLLNISKRALSFMPNHVPALLTLSTAQLYLGEYEASVATTDRIIATDADCATAYLNAGLCYYFQAQNMTQQELVTQNGKDTQKLLYRRALPYLEKYRALREDDTNRWAEPLYNIYLNLNMGDEFEEVDKILYGE